MTRDYTFTLPMAVNNLWSLINATITDPTFTDSSYVPKIVRSVNLQIPTSNAVGTSVQLTSGTGSTEILRGDSYPFGSSEGLTVDLSKYSVTPSVANVVVNVHIEA